MQAAVDAVPANNTIRRTITIKAGTYREIVTIPASKPFITLKGLGASNANTTIVNNRDAGHFGLQGSGTVQAYGKDLAVENLTITNDYDENTYETGDQALALYLGADRARFHNVRLLGDQDTFLVDNNARTSTLTSAIKVARPWTDMSTNTWQNARYFEYRNTGAGATTNSNRPQMSDSTAANYTPQKYLAGTDGWNPL